MTRYLAAYAIAAILFGLLDFLWLSRMAPSLYRPLIGEIMADNVRWGAAISFYFIYIAGMVWFAVRPGIDSGQWLTALVQGALLGGLCYATYDLTNQATLRVWDIRITLADIAWGTFATGLAAGGTAWIINRFLPAN